MKNTNEIYERIIHDAPTAMLATHDSLENIVSRPMHTIIDSENKKTLWIFSKIENNVCDQIDENNSVCLSFADPAKNSYMSVLGEAFLVKDPAIMKKYWSPIMKAWYPEGLEDPTMILIKVEPTSAEFWDGPSSKVVQMFGMAKAILSGEEYDGGKDGTGHVGFKGVQ